MSRFCRHWIAVRWKLPRGRQWLAGSRRFRDCYRLVEPFTAMTVNESERVKVRRKTEHFIVRTPGAGAMSGAHRSLHGPIQISSKGEIKKCASHHASYGLLIRGGATTRSRGVSGWGTVWLIRPGADRSIFFVEFSESSLSLCFFV